MRVFLFFTLISVFANAEYRAFRLEISSEDGSQRRQVASTLDDIQYPEYYPLSPGEKVTILDSWMCWGDTWEFTPICPKPGLVGPPLQ